MGCAAVNAAGDLPRLRDGTRLIDETPHRMRGGERRPGNLPRLRDGTRLGDGDAAWDARR
jgi:hypothetical protein